jgi:hypothetical protein
VLVEVRSHTVDTEHELGIAVVLRRGSGAGRCRRGTWRTRCWISAESSHNVNCEFSMSAADLFARDANRPSVTEQRLTQVGRFRFMPVTTEGELE